MTPAALPALLRQGRSLHAKQTFYCSTAAGEQSDIETLAKRAPRQAELLTLLADAGGGGVDTDALGELFPRWRQAAKGLLAKGLIAHFDAQAELPEAAADQAGEAGPDLNEDQLAALAILRKHDRFAASLLDGVTGSGKTEVYLQLMLDALARGQQILVLVPEIGLTPQLVGRLQQRLGIMPALMHSGLSDLERLRAWRDARSGQARLVVGTRSAIFAPLPKLGFDPIE